MSEIRNIQTQAVDQPCPMCAPNNGWMRPNGLVSGNQYQHKCTACNYTSYYPIRYPYIVQ